MKKLHSPWRSTYIKSFSNGKKTRSCLFCSVPKGRLTSKNLVVWKGEFCFIVLNRFPYNSGHFMVVPYRHTGDFTSLTAKETAEIMRASSMGMNALREISDPHGFNFGANLGRVAGAGIDKHVHFHIVPRWSGDTNFMPVLGDVKLISEDLEDLWKKMKDLLKDER
ncbi:MAG: HIT domain-containing protein [bacterium]